MTILDAFLNAKFPPPNPVAFRHPPTPEQEAIAAAVRGGGNLIVTAYAGTGKTTTLVDWVAPNLDPKVPALALAFNVKIKKDLETRFPPNFRVLTLNGLGHTAWGRAIRKTCVVDQRKLGKIITAEGRAYGITKEQWQDTLDVVTLAMQQGLVPNKFPHKTLVPDTPTEWERLAQETTSADHDKMLQFYREVLIKSIQESMKGLISFDDQVYMSAMFGGDFPRYGVVLVDEAQDLSPLNHIQIARCASDRLIVVGDPRQAIYAFRGASSDSMARLRGLRQQWTELPLTLTFRCPPAIVERQQKHAPGFRSFKKERGEVFTFVEDLVDWDEIRDGKEQPSKWRWGDIPKTDSLAVLCRNNAPLLSLAFKLIRQGIGPVMLGRDIGKGLVKLSKEIVKNDNTSLSVVRDGISSWLRRAVDIALANGEDHKVEELEDKGQSLLAVLDSLPPQATAAHLRTAIESLFSKETGVVTLSSIHRAKGLEFSTVVVLDPWRIPSKFACKSRDRSDGTHYEQEMNLRYVAETRTKSTLILANLSDFN